MVLYEVLLVAYLIVAILLVGFVLLQQGKGADAGASFGAGGANTVFGSSGSGNFMTRATAILATLFFAISLVIGGITSSRTEAVDEFQTIEPLAIETPAVDSSSNDFPVVVDDAVASSEDAPITEDKP